MAVAYRFNGRFVQVFKLTMEIEWTIVPTSQNLVDGRYRGNGWDQSADRGYLWIDRSGVLRCVYTGATITINGSLYDNTALQAGIKYTIECNSTSTGTNRGICSLFERFNSDGTESVENAYVYKFILEENGVKTIEYDFGTFDSPTAPEGQVFYNQVASTNVSVLALTGQQGWVITGNRITRNYNNWSRCYLCNANGFPPALVKVVIDVVRMPAAGGMSLFYTNRLSEQGVFDLPSIGSYTFYCDLSKDGRVYIDSMYGGMIIDVMSVEEVTDLYAHGGVPNWVPVT